MKNFSTKTLNKIISALLVIFLASVALYFSKERAVEIAKEIAVGSAEISTAQTQTKINKTLDSVQSGLVAHYTFDGAGVSATTVNDVSGNGNNGTIVGSAVPALGKIGQAFDFNGVDASISTSYNPTSLTSFSVSFWLYLNDTPDSDFERVIDTQDSGPEDGFDFVFGTAAASELDNLAFVVKNGLTSTVNIKTSDLSNQTWYHIVGTFETNSAKLYLNDVQQGVTDTSCSMSTSASSLTLGKRAASSSNFFNGRLDDVRVYNKVLTSVEITRLYNLGATSKINTSLDSVQSGLVGWWTFDGADTSATTATDKSVSGKTATFTGTVNKAIGKIGQGINLIGDTSHLQIVGDLAPTFDGNFTVSMWVKPQDKTGYSATFSDLIGNGAGNTVTGWVARFTALNKFQVITNTDAALPNGTVTGTVVYPFNVWYHFVFTQNVTTGESLMFVDGASTASTGSGEAGGVGSDTSKNLWLGGGAATAVRDTRGDIDDVRIYNRIITTAEITRLYNLGH